MIVGLTGGIGSGKSEVSARFERLGIKIVDADVVAREVVAPGSTCLDAIAKHFGLEMLNQDGSLNRPKLRKLIFENLQEKIWLEDLLHPVIRNETINQLNQSKSAYAILASPLLLETSQHELVDRILVVDATEDLQIARAVSRDTNNAEQIKKIMATQMNRATRCARADDIIYNHGDIYELEQQVQQLHKSYLALAQQYSQENYTTP